MKVYLVLIQLAGCWAEGEGAQQEVVHRYLDSLVESSLSFRGKIIETRLIEREGTCQITEDPLDWQGR